MNPSASKLEHTLSINGKSAAPDMNAVLETAAFYRLTEGEAKQVIADIRKVISTWRDEAARLKLSRQEIQRMEPVFARFDH
jgi:serine/threonine-protein kinase HipA